MADQHRWHLPITGTRDIAFTGTELTKGVGKWDVKLEAFVPILHDQHHLNHHVYRTKANQLIFFCTRPYEDGAGTRKGARIYPANNKPSIAALYDFFGDEPPVEAFEAIGHSHIHEVA